jgi:thymidylate synthase (FAD)
LKVELITYTPNPDSVVALAGKLCYSPIGIDKLQETLTDEQIQKFVNMLMDMGHESPIEHVSFTFAIEGVSRALTHQLVRHRIASYSQQSQRYVRLDNFEYVVPPEIEKIPYAKMLFIKTMECDQLSYDMLVEELMKNGRTEKEAIEDARYVFPNACTTKIIVTMNARSLYNFFAHRCCTRAQWEIRELGHKMLKAVKEVSPVLFKNAGASCTQLGYCPEGKMSCHRYETLKELKGE